MISFCHFRFDGYYKGTDEYMNPETKEVRYSLLLTVQGANLRVPIDKRMKAKLDADQGSLLEECVRVRCLLEMNSGRKVYTKVQLRPINPQAFDNYGAFQGVCEPILHEYEKNNEFFQVLDLSFFGSTLQLTNDDVLLQEYDSLNNRKETPVSGRFRWETRHKKSGDSYYQALEPQYFDVHFRDGAAEDEVEPSKKVKRDGSGEKKES